MKLISKIQIPSIQIPTLHYRLLQKYNMLQNYFFAALLKCVAIFLLNSVVVEAKSEADVTRDIAIAAIVIGGVAFLMSCCAFCTPRPKFGQGSGAMGMGNPTTSA